VGSNDFRRSNIGRNGSGFVDGEEITKTTMNWGSRHSNI
jgi:hypothetical protein